MNRNITLEDRINQTALHMFTAQGFDSVTVNDICKEVGITKPTFYRYVTSKEDILNSYYSFNPSREVPDWDDVSDGNCWKAIETGFVICYSHYLSLGTEMLSRLMMSQISKSAFTFQEDEQWNTRMMELITQAIEVQQIQCGLEPPRLFDLLISVSLGYCFYSCTEDAETIGEDEYRRILRTIARVPEECYAGL